MKRNYFKSVVVAALALLAMGMRAAPVDVAAARDRALRELSRAGNGKLMKPSADFVLAHTQVSKADAARADYYVFNASGGGGFVIAAGDDRAPAVLAWGEGSFDVEQAPCNVKWLLQQYSRQMECLVAHADETPRVRMRRSPAMSLTVAPLLTSTWSQSTPFYDQCPTYGGFHSATGCTATAMAQVMYYWKFPAELPPLPAYITGTLGLEVPALPGTRLDWDNMMDRYSSAAGYTAQQGAAVATLMRYCGQACFMDYSPNGSGAHQAEKLAGLTTFGYSIEAAQYYRDDCDAETWDAMLQDDLSAGRPVLYVGYGDAGGHSFVIDGCADGLYHVNWGWAGGYIGYYSLDMLGEGRWAFNYNQSLLHGVCPDESGEEHIAYDFEHEGIYYKLQGDEVAVVNRDYSYNSYHGTVSIPATVVHEGKTYQVTAIGDNAFRNCPQLEHVDLPNTIRTIGVNAFRNCNLLRDIFIGKNLTVIGESAFYECLSLKRVDIEDVAAYCRIEFRDFYSNPFVYEANMYHDGEQVSELVIPGSVEEIQESGFYYCVGITSVVISEGVKRIGDCAFNECYGLRSLTLPASLEHVGYAAFAYCEALENLDIRGENLSMDEFPFYGCMSLKHISLPEGQTILPLGAFGECTALEQVDLGHSLETIGDYAFYLCPRLKGVTIPETLTSVGEEAFNGCTGLKSVDAASLAAWCGIRFMGETANPVSLSKHLSINGQPLQECVVPEGITAIGDYAFMGCEDLTAVTLPAGLSAIGRQAFLGCSNLETLNMGDDVKTIGDKAFKDCKGMKSVNASSLAAWCGINFMSETANPVSQSRHLSIGGQPLQQFVLPEGVTAIGDYTFTSCEDLTSVVIPRGVVSIGKNAFYQNKNLETVTLGDDVKTVGDKAFSLCASLKSVNLGSSVEYIGTKAFSSCMVITDVTCASVTPPAVDGTSCFTSGVFKKATLRVPARSQVAYRDATPWGQFNAIRVISNAALADVNRDGEVNIADVNTIVDAILHGDDAHEGTSVLDVNGDGEITVADINFVVSAIVGHW